MRGTILIDTAKRDKVTVDTVSKKSFTMNLFNELLSKSNITYQIITRLTEIFDYHWSVAAFCGQIFLCDDVYNLTNFLVTLWDPNHPVCVWLYIFPPVFINQ